MMCTRTIATGAGITGIADCPPNGFCCKIGRTKRRTRSPRTHSLQSACRAAPNGPPDHAVSQPIWGRMPLLCICALAAAFVRFVSCLVRVCPVLGRVLFACVLSWVEILKMLLL